MGSDAVPRGVAVRVALRTAPDLKSYGAMPSRRFAHAPVATGEW